MFFSQLFQRKHYTPKFLMAFVAVALGNTFQQGFNLTVLNAPAKHIIAWSDHLFNNDSLGPIDCDVSDTFSAQSAATNNSCEAVVGRNPSDFYYSILVSMYMLGGMFGSLVSGIAGDGLGRKRAILYNNIICFVGTTLLVISYHIGFAGYWTFLFGRLIIGFNSGLNSSMCLTYLMEISPPSIRSTIASLNIFILTLGIFASTFIGIFLSECGIWHSIFFFNYIPIAISIAILPRCPESPKYAFKKSRQKAEDSLLALRHSSHDIDEELDTFRDAREQISFLGIFQKPYRWPLFLCVSMMATQQFVGISAVSYYSTKIFQGDAGLDDLQSKYATAGMMLVSMISAVIAVWLIAHPHIGRRFLILSGLTGCWFIVLLLFVVLKLLDCSDPTFPRSPTNYFAIGLLIIYMIIYNSEPSPVIWVIVSESFHSFSRPKASAVASSANWFFSFTIGLVFNPLRNAIGVYVFLLLVAIGGSMIVFLFLFLPETKGKTVEQLEEEWKNGILCCKTGIHHHNYHYHQQIGETQSPAGQESDQQSWEDDSDMDTLRDAISVDKMEVRI